MHTGRPIPPPPARPLAFALFLCVVLGGARAAVPTPMHAAADWAPTAPPATPAAEARRYGTATLLPDGRVLVAGGIRKHDTGLDEADLYHPATDTWTAAPPMRAPRSFHTATRLANGRVLVVGGRGFYGGDEYVAASAELFDPRTNRWEWAAALATPREGHTATLLPDGRVLIAGGRNGGYNALNALTTAELYDPAADRWTAAGTLATARFGHRAAPLPGGGVLVAGGSAFGPPQAGEPFPPVTTLATAERYDPAANRWLPAAAMAHPRDAHTLTPLPTGEVLVAGGRAEYGQGTALAAAERYDPRTDRWLPAGALADARLFHTATLLPSGHVLVTGNAAGAERYDPAVGRWEPAGTPTYTRFAHNAVRLLDGRLLVTGGYDSRAMDEGPGTAEVYSDGERGACFIETDACLHGRFLAHWAANGGLARNGFPLTFPFLQRLEDGVERTVQYFERVRLELHPEHAPPHDILLGQFGRRILATVPAAPTAPVPAEAGYRYFPETGHNVGPRFATFWETNGGLPQFGFPLTEPFEQRLEDGGVYTVQYFERARFELHPENSPPHDVLLGQFGRWVLAEDTPHTLALDPAAGPRATHIAARGASFTPGVASRCTLRRDHDGAITAANSQADGKPANADGTYDNILPLFGRGPNEPAGSTSTGTVMAAW